MNAVIVPQPRRRFPTPLLLLAASVAGALLILGAASVAGLAIQGRAAAARPIPDTVAACPAAEAGRP